MDTVPAYVDWQACTAILRSAGLADYKVRLKLPPLVMVGREGQCTTAHCALFSDPKWVPLVQAESKTILLPYSHPNFSDLHAWYCVD